MILGILAGEPSGDRLGAGLMAALSARHPDVRFVGIGGPLMIDAGLECLVPMERLSVNGFVEPLRRLPDLVRILKCLLDTYRREPPAAFIGVDFNVFNFLLERLLKGRGIPTAHYVSPSVYAWRRGRVRRIARSTDLLLTLYPFEPAFYRDSPVRAVFVGHPLADEISPQMGDDVHRSAARRDLGLPETGTVVAVLPGSRLSEVGLMGAVFFEACEEVRARLPDVTFVVPCLRPPIFDAVTGLMAAHPALDVRPVHGNARQALTACDVALVKSGTSTLEAMLLHRPMVVSYRLGELTYRLVKRLLRTPYVALPNILAGSELVPELLQHDATPRALAENVLAQLDKRVGDAEYLRRFEALHASLRRGADERAAEAVLGWLGRSENGSHTVT
ncbi:MAG: lipid-A-disaccharide synthase [Pseudomonadales bacterium]